jgi:hypothetical protein
MLGFATGSVWHFYHLTWWSDYLSPLARVQHVTLASTANANSRTPVGHVVFSGSNGVLLYDVCLRRTRLLQLKDIEEIWECRGSDCKIECADLREAASIPTSGIPAWPSQAFSGLRREIAQAPSKIAFATAHKLRPGNGLGLPSRWSAVGGPD